ncbi:MAG: hypothetical protein IJV58_04485, partial [Oscillospiraceae bacterium]|nr:hypothetical protein [Oscillospiraceae bacterium]
MKTAIIKLLLQLLTDEKTRKRLFLLIGSIIVGFMGFLIMPVIVLSTLGQMGTPEIEISMETLPVDTAEVAALEYAGQSIETVMNYLGLRRQTLKAQWIYLNYLDGGVDDYLQYGQCFQVGDDAALIGRINAEFGTEIDYEDFRRGYQTVLNATIDPYLFSEPATKNAADLAAWGRNAYESQWVCQGGNGEMNHALRRRSVNNVGLFLGYFNYMPDSRTFGYGIDTLVYTEQGSMETMPDVPGLAVYTGAEFGIYGGGGRVYMAAADGDAVQQ